MPSVTQPDVKWESGHVGGASPPIGALSLSRDKDASNRGLCPLGYDKGLI